MSEADDKVSPREHFGRPRINVGGHELVCHVDAELDIGDVTEGMTKVASQMGFWASVWASAAEQQMDVDAHYRAWRATRTRELLSEDPKLAEWKLKAELESDPNFLKYKRAIAHAERAVILARGMFEAAEGKSRVLQSRGAMMRDEMHATGMSTPTSPRARRAAVVEGDDMDLDAEPAPAPRGAPALPPKVDDRVSAMKSVFKKTKRDHGASE
jgi:hypothetical protein